MEHIFIKEGMTVLYTSPKTGRQTTVTVVRHLPNDTWLCAQAADPSKSRAFMREELTTIDGLQFTNEAQIARCAADAGLNAIITNPHRYQCAECGEHFNATRCPVCGSDDRM